MKRTIWLQETKRMRFKEAYGDWQQNRLTQEEAALILGVCADAGSRNIRNCDGGSQIASCLAERLIYLMLII